jgi:hypothetical protein
MPFLMLMILTTGTHRLNAIFDRFQGCRRSQRGFTMSRQQHEDTQSSGLSLEDGKFYRSRLGELVQVRLAYPGDEFCFEQVNDLPYLYRADGSYADNETDPIAILNLVEEIVPTPWAEISAKLRLDPNP